MFEETRASMKRDAGYEELSGTTLLFFGPHSKLRIYCHEIMYTKMFNWFILTSIVVSSVMLAFEDPTTSVVTKAKLVTVERVFAVIFTIEMAIKVISTGFFLVDKSYLRNSWNVLDFTIVVSSLADWGISAFMSDESEGLGFLKVLRLLRVLRPLKTIKRNKNMALVVSSVMGR